jgi:hypothetical protein
MMLAKNLTAVLLLTLACGDETAVSDTPAAASAAPAAPAAVPATEAVLREAMPVSKGAITGTVKFEGTAPERPKVDLSPDKVCADHHPEGMPAPGGVQADAGGGLMDVFVQLTTGLPDAKYETPATPAIIDQVGCNYVPHVLGVMKKQEIKILNSDPTLHNIHAQPKTNKEFNLAMPNKGDERKVEFKKAEEAIHVKCDVHNWMSLYCFTMEHPFFAVSGPNGAWTIDLGELPDGEYGIKLWHEVLGTQEGKVTVKDGAGSFDCTFKK